MHVHSWVFTVQINTESLKMPLKKNPLLEDAFIMKIAVFAFLTIHFQTKM